MNNNEYLRRNLLHAGSIGAYVTTVKTLERLQNLKRPPVWLVEALQGIESRTKKLPHELAQWRDVEGLPI